MAIGVYVALSGMSTDKYRECTERLKQAGAAHPPGRSYHAAFGPPDKLAVFDVWSSQAAFDKFGQTLMPILQELGVDAGQLSVLEIHKVVKPPVARKAKSKAKSKGKSKSKAKKPAAARQAKRRRAKKR
jgi:hypothetical protein